MGIGPMTSSLPKKCSASELSGRVCRVKDSNLRRHRRLIYSQLPLAARATRHDATCITDTTTLGGTSLSTEYG